MFSGQSGSLFQNNQLPTIGNSLFKGNDEGDDSGDSAELEKRQSMDVDPTKSNVKFDYKGASKVLKVVSLSKYKK